jgi:hypothetical protein
MKPKYQIGDEIPIKDYTGRNIRVGDVVMAFEPDRPDSPWKFHFTEIGEDTLRDWAAHNVGMWQQPIINLGPYWRHLALVHYCDVNGNSPLIDDDDLRCNWGTTRREAIRRYVEEAGGDPAWIPEEEQTTND